MARLLHDLRAAVRQVFRRPPYAALATLLAAAAFLLAVWAPNLGLLAQVAADPDAPPGATLGLAATLLGAIATNFSVLAAASTTATAVLFGLAAAMITYLVKRGRGAATGSIAMGSGATASGALGVGCAACGSLVVSVFAPALGASAALAALPLQGEEFGLASVALLVASLLLVSRRIAEPGACPAARSAVRSTTTEESHGHPIEN